MQTYGMLAVYLRTVLTSVLDGNGRMRHTAADLISGKERTVPVELVCWVGPRAGLTALEKIQIFSPLPFVEPKC